MPHEISHDSESDSMRAQRERDRESVITPESSEIAEPATSPRRRPDGADHPTSAPVASGIVAREPLRTSAGTEATPVASGIVAWNLAAPSSAQHMHGARSFSTVDRRHGMAGSHLPARSASDLGRVRQPGASFRADPPSTRYGSTSGRSLVRSEFDEDLDGYETASDELDSQAGWYADDERHSSRSGAQGESDTDSEGSVRVMLGSQRRSTDPEIVPAHEAPVSPARSSTGSRRTPAESTISPIPEAPQLASTGATAAVPPARVPATAYLRAQANLIASLSNLASAVGWLLVRRVPLMQPIGQSLASALKNGTYAIDEFYKGNLFKTAGQTIYASGSLTGMIGQTVVTSTGNSSFMGIRTVGAALNATGQTMNALADVKKKAHKRASGWFTAAALNLMGTIGFTIEASHSNREAFVALESMQSFHNTANPISGAAEDAGKSKVRQPWLRDPKVTGQGITHVGYLLNSIAWTLNKIYMMKDRETGGDESQRLTPLVSALGASGMVLVSIGQLVSAYAELPKQPAPVRNDIEMAVPPAQDHRDPPTPPGDALGSGTPAPV